MEPQRKIEIPAEVLDWTGNHCMQLVIQLRSLQKRNEELQEQLIQAQEQNAKLVEVIDDAKIKPE